nr:biotin transporter BioY [Actinomyces sp.]
MTTNQRSSHSLTATPDQVRSHGRVRAALVEVGLVMAGTAAIALIGQVRLPLPFTPVPVTLGTLAVMGVGGLLGARRGLASVALFALAACLGAPVLAGWGSGVSASFGYVLGYALAVVVAGRAASVGLGEEQGVGSSYRAGALSRRIALLLVASALVYVPGVAWLKVSTGAAWGTVVSMGVAPFVLGDVLKSVVAGLLPRLPLRRC